MSNSMIQGIEEGIIARLVSAWARAGGAVKVTEFDIATNFADMLKVPAIAAVTEKIGARRVCAGNYELTPIVTVYAVFKNPADPRARRNGCLPIVEGIIRILSGKKFDLDIEPLSPVGQISEVYHENLKKQGLVAFKLEFETSFTIEEDYEDTGDDLVTSLVKYYRQDPADTTADAQDTITLHEEEA